MDKVIGILHNPRFITLVTWLFFWLSVFFTGLAAYDIAERGFEQPNNVREALKKFSTDTSVALVNNSIALDSMVSMLLARGVEEIDTLEGPGGIIHLSGINIFKTNLKVREAIFSYTMEQAGKTPVAFLARFVSGFAACLFLLLFLHLFGEAQTKKVEPNDFSILFFALSFLAWSLPTGVTIKTYDYLFFQNNYNAIHTSRGFLNSIFLICAYWDLKNKGISWIWFKNIGERLTLNWFVTIISIFTLSFEIAFFTKFAESRINAADDPTWFDIFDFIFSLLFILLLAWAFMFGMSQRMKSKAGMWLGFLVGTGFLVVILAYLIDHPFDNYYILKQFKNGLESFVDARILTMIYQFLILISVSFLAFSWSYEGEKRKAEDLNIKEGELRHYARNMLLLFEKEVVAKRKANSIDFFGNYVVFALSNLRGHFNSSKVSIANTKIQLKSRIEELLQNFEGIFEKIPSKNIDISEKELDAESTFKLIGILNELMLNAQKHGGGIESVSIIEGQDSIQISVENHSYLVPFEFKKQIENSEIYPNDTRGLGFNFIKWYIKDLDKKAIIISENKTITITFKKSAFVL